jgi:BirA family biotin operon repressor/biotin-[acetyl-CoA-carboxylase] ligase
VSGGGTDAAAAGTSQPSVPPGWRLVIEESLPSTSESVIRLAEAGEPEGLALMARQQTAGRGRGGRAWTSPPGNLYVSILLRPRGAARESAQWSLLAGVVLAEAAAEIDPEPAALRLKWPNDLLRHGAKVAGILTNAALDRAGPGGPETPLAWVVLGIGVNLATAPAMSDRPTATLGRGEAPEAFATRLLARLDHWRRVQAAQGFGPVRAAWEAHGPDRDAPLTVRNGPGDAAATLVGRYKGLAVDGSLLLDTGEPGGGLRRIAAGEVVEEGR